ncbi:MAG: hypothetical protein NW241_22740 [Bacteroidia bacterium]|nr:hypothetical protein [Bacteroidia bacterium]
MQLKTLKSRLMPADAQILLFRAGDGILLDSCHTLADVSAQLGQPVYELYPLTAAFREAFPLMHAGSEPVVLPTVEGRIGSRAGFFDMAFYPHPRQPGLIAWMAQDQSDRYRQLQMQQQERNVRIMEQEYRKLGRQIRIEG